MNLIAHTRTTLRANLLASALLAAATAAAAPLTDTDKAFLADAAADNQTEITLGQTAALQAASPDVKAFGRRMVTDHSKIARDVKKLDPSVSPSPPPLPDELQGKTGKDFDRAYMDKMVADHDQDVAKFEKVAADHQYSAKVRAAVKKALPIIRRHDALAKSIDAKLQG